MKRPLSKGLLTSAALAARMMCQAGVYNQYLAPHLPDEVRVQNYHWGYGTNVSIMEYYVSTNALTSQPRWDGLSIEAPLSPRAACALALAHVRKLVPEVQKWSIESVNLRQPDSESYPDVWCYDITLEPKDRELKKKLLDRGCTSFYQMVLFDGTVVLPRAANQK